MDTSVVATQGDEFNLDSLILNNITDDDLYKTFLNTENEGSELVLQPSLSLDNQYGQEISGLEGLDLGSLDFLQDPVIKLEPQQEEDLQSSPINTQKKKTSLKKMYIPRTNEKCPEKS